MKNVKEEISLEEITKGMTANEIELWYVSKGMRLIKSLVTSVLGSTLSAGQRDHLDKVLEVIEGIREVRMSRKLPKDK